MTEQQKSGGVGGRGGGNKQTTKPTNKIINGIENKTKEQSITTFSNAKVVWNMMSGKGLQANY